VFVAVWSQFQDRHQLAAGFDHSPYPHNTASLAHLGPQLIQLEVVQDQVVEEVAVHFARIKATLVEEVFRR
jgi:hypothetical protein